MGIYDREYYRNDGPSFLGSLADSGKICKWLIGINVAVFVLQLVTYTAPSFDLETREILPGSAPVTEALDLDTAKVLHGQVWRILTCAFLHSPGNFMHILFNMLFLWWFGHAVEDIYGSKEFLAFYLVAAVVSSLVYVGWQLIGEPRPWRPALGASGAVMAVMVVFALHYPHYKILMFWFVPVSVWLLVLFEVAQDAYVFLLGAQTMTAVTAHLGGAAFGFLYFKRDWRMVNLWPDFQSRRRARARPRLRLYREETEADRVGAPAATASPDVDEHLEAQVDAVLEKMARSGKESLTDSEREILLRASEVYKRRRT